MKARPLLCLPLVALAAGCGGSGLHASPAAHTASRPTGPPSLKTVLRLTRNVPCLNARQPRVGPAAVSRFRAVTAVSCTDAIRTYPGQGQWEVHVRRVAVGSVSGWQKYFEQPSVTKHPKHLICTANLIVLLVPVLVDAEGHWLVPKTPVDACDHPLGYADYGKGSTLVRWHVVSVRRIRQLVSAPALAAHCAMNIKDEPSGAIGPLAPSPGGPVFAKTPRTVRVCVYRMSPKDYEIGDFVRGFPLDASQTRTLLGALTGAAPSGSCTNQSLFAVVVASPETSAEVELGGCYRVARFDGEYRVGTADPSVVRALLGGDG